MYNNLPSNKNSPTRSEMGLSHKTIHYENKEKVTATTSKLCTLVRGNIPLDIWDCLAENPQSGFLFIDVNTTGLKTARITIMAV